MRGYDINFLEGHKVPNPLLSDENKEVHFQSLMLSLDDFYLDYVNYSLLQSPTRRFPLFTSTNIDGNLFKSIKRSDLFNGSDKWSKDDRINDEYQLGKELYKADSSDFDRGHLTKREDTQWGATFDEAKQGAESTFFYTNSIPQMAKFNRGIWKDIENYILHDQTRESDLKVTMFTGPVLTKSDPIFVTKVEDKDIQIPYLFWKVVYYINKGELYRTSFIAGQKNLLVKKEIIADDHRDDVTPALFQNFKDAETYQVKTEEIEKLCGLTFATAKENYKDDRPTKLIIEETDVRGENDVHEAKILNLTI